MKNLHKFLIVSVLACLVSGCTKDFQEINTNPNAPATVTLGLLLPDIQRDMMNEVLNESWPSAIS